MIFFRFQEENLHASEDFNFLSLPNFFMLIYAIKKCKLRDA